MAGCKKTGEASSHEILVEENPFLDLLNDCIYKRCVEMQTLKTGVDNVNSCLFWLRESLFLNRDGFVERLTEVCRVVARPIAFSYRYEVTAKPTVDIEQYTL